MPLLLLAPLRARLLLSAADWAGVGAGEMGWVWGWGLGKVKPEEEELLLVPLLAACTLLLCTTCTHPV